MCGYADHREEDHRNASADAHYRLENGNVTWDEPPKGVAKVIIRKVLMPKVISLNGNQSVRRELTALS